MGKVGKASERTSLAKTSGIRAIIIIGKEVPSMSRTHGKQQWPAAEVKQPDKQWAAELFMEKGGVFQYSTHTAVRVHSNNDDILTRLHQNFGGRVHPVGTTRRWMVYGEPLLTFLDMIRPFLPAEGLRRIALIEGVVAAEKRAAMRGESSLRRKAVLLEQGAAATPSVEEAEGDFAAPETNVPTIAADANVPPEPWVAADFTYIAEEMTFRAAAPEEAKAFAEAAAGYNLQARIAGLIVYLKPAEKEEEVAHA
jgi:hypothetical protein